MAFTSNLPFGQMLRQLPDVFFRYRFVPAPGYEYVNDAITTMTGYTPDEFYSQPDLTRTLIHPDDRDRLREGIANARAGNPMPTVTMRWVCKDGRVIWTEQRNHAVFDADGRLVAVEGVVRDITERIATDDALRASEARLQLLLESSPAMIYMLFASAEGVWRLKSISPNVRGQLGYDPDELKARNAWPQLVHPDDREIVLRASVELRTSGSAIVEYRFRHADGSYRWIHDEGKLTRDAQGNELVVGCWLDVTNRREAEAALRERDAHYRTIMEHGTDAIVTMSPQGIITFQSPTSWTMFGYTAEEMVGTSPFDRIHPDDVERVRTVFTDTILRGVPGRADYRYRHRSGEWVYVESFGRPVQDGSGAVVAGVVSTRDITERHRAAEAAREADAFRRAIEDSVRAGLVAHDAEGRITYVNRTFVEMFGWSAAELIGRTAPFPFWPPEKVDQIMPVFRRIVLEGELPNSPVPLRLMRRNGERLDVEILVSALDTAQGPMALAAMADVTERRLLEAEFRQAQKLEAIGRLAGGIAHDLNNILTAILGYADMALDDVPVIDPLHGELEEIRRAGERAAALTRQLLAFSRQQVLQPAVLDLNVVVNELTRMLRRVISEDVQLRTDLAPALPAIKADRGQIEQMLMNLVVNARDAMPTGGRLLIQSGFVRFEAARQTIAGEIPPGEYVALAVSDTGSGMSPQIVSHLFEPFFTTKEQGKGTGLGLATVYGIVKQTGGRIAVDTKPDWGTSFTVFLPVTHEVSSGPAEARPNTPSGGRGETILFVDDEPSIVALGCEVLSRHGYVVRPASSAEQAVADTDGDVDLLLTDVVMPGMNGPALARLLAARFPSIRALFMSGYTGGALDPAGLIPAGAALLPKPFTPMQLLERVRAVLDAPRVDGA